MRRIRIRHLTTYEYLQTVEFLPHKLLLRPREGHDVRVESSRLEITPAYSVKWHRDVHDNSVAVVEFRESSSTLSILSEVVIENYQDAPLDFLIDPHAVNFSFHYDATEGIDLMPYQLSVYPRDSQLLRNWIDQFWRVGQTQETYVLLDNINKSICSQIEYKLREEPGVQSPAMTLSKGTGSCRDMATLFMEACRHIGLAARFVSGYQLSPIAAAGNGSTHAWSEIYLPGAGWKGFDSTNGEIVGSQHISVAVSRHPEAIPPVAGAYLGAPDLEAVMNVKIEVLELV